MIQVIKILFIYIIRIILLIIYIIPINKRKVVFSSYNGKIFGCNPKYVFEYLINNYCINNFKIIWILKDKNMLPSEYKDVTIVKHFSFLFFFHLLTAGYIISNTPAKSYLPFRKKQIIVNTWHGGGAYKKIGLDTSIYIKNRISMEVTRKKTSEITKYVITSCKLFTDICSRVWSMPKEKFLPIGMPRNDVFFGNSTLIKKKVMEYFDFEEKTKIVLYAPTFRGDFRKAQTMDISFDILNIIKSLKLRFNYDFQFLFRLHLSSPRYYIDETFIKSASDYPDMQELLCAADVLITDYSSSVWDFSFTYKPCFLYTPDLERYREEQGFYTPIEDWPFPLAINNDQLVDNIINFDEKKYEYDVKKHHDDLGSYENGTACKQLCHILFFNS